MFARPLIPAACLGIFGGTSQKKKKSGDHSTDPPNLKSPGAGVGGELRGGKIGNHRLEPRELRPEAAEGQIGNISYIKS